jgi:hypothetical protein
MAQARIAMLAACLVTAAGALQAAPLCEQDSERLRDVQMQLVEAALKLRLEDAEISARPVAGCLPSGRVLTLPIRLAHGGDYAIVAVCETEVCQDLDLLVLDDANRVVGADVQTAGEPRVDLQISQGGEFVLRVLLSECLSKRAERCAVAVGVFRRTEKPGR